MAGSGPPSPTLIIEYLTGNPTTYGPQTVDGVISDALEVGWSWYSRYPASAFFTLRQGSLHNTRLLPRQSHVRIYYTNQRTAYGPKLVFSGRVVEPDMSGDDVVWTCWNYLADLSLSRSGYRTMYQDKLIGTEVASPEWNLAKTADHSVLAHILTGTIENPIGSDGVTPIKTDTRFGLIDVPRLLLMFDLTEIGRANTANNVTFEFTREPPATFNFWANKGTKLESRRLTHPGVITDYRLLPGFAELRTDIATIGSSATGGSVEIVATTADATTLDTYGRLQDVFTIKTLMGEETGTTENDAQVAITNRAVTEASTLQNHLALDINPAVWDPFDDYELEDKVHVEIDRGRTLIDADFRIIGLRGRANAQGYFPQLLLEPVLAGIGPVWVWEGQSHGDGSSVYHSLEFPATGATRYSVFPGHTYRVTWDYQGAAFPAVNADGPVFTIHACAGLASCDLGSWWTACTTGDKVVTVQQGAAGNPPEEVWSGSTTVRFPTNPAEDACLTPVPGFVGCSMTSSLGDNAGDWRVTIQDLGVM